GGVSRQVDRRGFDHGGYLLALAQRQFGGGLRGDQRHQRKAAIELHPRQGAFRNHRAHASRQPVARTRYLIHLARDGDVLGADAGLSISAGSTFSTPTDSATWRSAGRRKTSCTGPVWRIRPSTITAIQSPSATASMRSWVTTMLGTPPARSMRRSSWRVRERVGASNAESGSSSSNSAGSAP